MKKLLRAAKLVEKVGYGEILKDYGYKAVRCASHGTSAIIYYNKREGIVIKNSYLFIKDIPPYAVETVFIPSPDGGLHGRQNQILIQPFVNKKGAGEAKKIILKKYSNFNKLNYPDIAARNVGFYRRKAVAFDW